MRDENDLVLGTVTSAATTIETNGSITLSDDLNVTGALDLTTDDGAIEQTGGYVIVTGVTDIDSVTGLVDLSSETNNFGDRVNVNSGVLTLGDENDLVLGTVTSAATTIETDGSITQVKKVMLR